MCYILDIRLHLEPRGENTKERLDLTQCRSISCTRMFFRKEKKEARRRPENDCWSLVKAWQCSCVWLSFFLCTAAAAAFFLLFFSFFFFVPLIFGVWRAYLLFNSNISQLSINVETDNKQIYIFFSLKTRWIFSQC